MGNLAFVSFRRAVSDEQFASMLTSIIDDNYGVCFEVIVQEFSNGCTWTVQPKKEVLGEHENMYSYMLKISRAYNRLLGKPYRGKFEHKYMRGGPWSYWFMHQIHGHFCKQFKAILSGECMPGTWKIDPSEYPTARDYNMGQYEFFRENPEHLELFLNKVPLQLRNLKG